MANGASLLIGLLTTLLLATLAYFFSPKGENQTVWRSTLILSFASCYIMWAMVMNSDRVHGAVASFDKAGEFGLEAEVRAGFMIGMCGRREEKRREGEGRMGAFFTGTKYKNMYLSMMEAQGGKANRAYRCYVSLLCTMRVAGDQRVLEKAYVFTMDGPYLEETATQGVRNEIRFREVIA
ncbi:MAG: hypothetical protein LQ338_005286 [Usnochroma carphineum]|nr:MAG: hypothetical protein LQ338_005286 [Usnochroma carphineum]